MAVMESTGAALKRSVESMTLVMISEELSQHVGSAETTDCAATVTSTTQVEVMRSAQLQLIAITST